MCGQTGSAAAESFNLQPEVALKLFQLRPQLARIRQEYPGIKRNKKTKGTQPGAYAQSQAQKHVCNKSNILLRS